MLTRNKPMSRGAGFQRLPPGHPDRSDRSDEFASWTPRARPVAAAVMARADGQADPAPKIADPHDQRIRDSARGEECTVRIIGACTHDPAHTIWSHAPLQAAGKGRSWKAVDLAGAYCCTACDAVVDGQRQMPPGATRESVLLDWFMGHMRSLVLLKRKGLA